MAMDTCLNDSGKSGLARSLFLSLIMLYEAASMISARQPNGCALAYRNWICCEYRIEYPGYEEPAGAKNRQKGGRASRAAAL